MSEFKEINTENKLRIALSPLAMETIRSDGGIFEMPLATLVNRIISNYSQDASCSVSVRLSKYHADLSNIIGDNTDAIEKLVAAKEKELINAIPVYKEALSPHVFRVNNENLILLTRDNTSHEEKYYKKGMKSYVQAMVEEFSRLPFVARERYYYKAAADELLLARDRNEAVWIRRPGRERSLYRVYDIMTDPLSMYNYAVVANIPQSGSEEMRKTFSFRLSRITEVLRNPNVSGTFTSADTEWVEADIKRKGVQFMSGSNRFVKVYLTDEGIKKYKTILHLRPQCLATHGNGHIYVFDCNPIQAEYYFMRFGPDAKVISPKRLTDRMASNYSKANDLYKSYIPEE